MVKNLKKLRAEKKVSQQQLANALGISQQSINKYENHNIEPDIATLVAMADFFETSVDYLIGNTTINRPVQNYKPYDLSETEQKIIDGYRTLGNAEKICICTLIDTYIAINNKTIEQNHK